MRNLTFSTRLRSHLRPSQTFRGPISSEGYGFSKRPHGDTVVVCCSIILLFSCSRLNLYIRLLVCHQIIHSQPMPADRTRSSTRLSNHGIQSIQSESLAARTDSPALDLNGVQHNLTAVLCLHPTALSGPELKLHTSPYNSLKLSLDTAYAAFPKVRLSVIIRSAAHAFARNALSRISPTMPRPQMAYKPYQPRSLLTAVRSLRKH